MPLTNAGCEMMARAVARGCGGASVGPLFLGVGNSSSVFDASQSGMLGESQTRHALLPTYPQVVNSTISLTADFPPGAAPSEILEEAVFDSLSGGSMLSRLVVGGLGEILSHGTCRAALRLNIGLEEGGGFTTIGRSIFAEAAASGLANAVLTPIFFGLNDGGDDFVRAPMAPGYPAARGVEVHFVGSFEMESLPFTVAEFELYDALVGGNLLYRAAVDLDMGSIPQGADSVAPSIVMTILST
jgi:hypothetical protein